MKLFEVMNTRVEATWHQYNANHVKATFPQGEVTIEVDFELLDNPQHDPGARGVITPEKAWAVTFMARTPDKRSTFGKTGLGDEFRVFAAVGNIVFDFIKNHNNPPIFFSADEENRQRLYARFERKLKTIGYVLITDKRDMFDAHEWVYTHKDDQRMRDVNEARDYTKQQQKHSELRLLDMLDKKDFGKKVKTKTTDTLVKDSMTKTIYGRRALIQRDL